MQRQENVRSRVCRAASGRTHGRALFAGCVQDGRMTNALACAWRGDAEQHEAEKIRRRMAASDHLFSSLPMAHQLPKRSPGAVRIAITILRRKTPRVRRPRKWLGATARISPGAAQTLRRDRPGGGAYSRGPFPVAAIEAGHGAMEATVPVDAGALTMKLRVGGGYKQDLIRPAQK